MEEKFMITKKAGIYGMIGNIFLLIICHPFLVGQGFP